jgi:ABC-2 type transport system permease protein
VTAQAGPRGQVLAFTRAHTRELFRYKHAPLALLVGFVALLGLFWGIDLLVAGATGRSTGLLRKSVPLVAVNGFLAVALMLTTVPLVAYRANGVLSQLSTTPAHRRAFLLGHVPVRAGIVALEAAVLTAVALASGTGSGDAASLTVTLLIGGAMTLSLGYLLAARMTNPDRALQLSYIIPILVLATSGAMFPLSALPEWIAIAFRTLPTAWFVDALTSQVSGSTPFLPLSVSWLLMLLVAALAAYVAVRFHRWRTNT